MEEFSIDSKRPVTLKKKNVVSKKPFAELLKILQKKKKKND
jgi:hypothetical protein